MVCPFLPFFPYIFFFLPSLWSLPGQHRRPYFFPSSLIFSICLSSPSPFPTFSSHRDLIGRPLKESWRKAELQTPRKAIYVDDRITDHASSQRTEYATICTCLLAAFFLPFCQPFLFIPLSCVPAIKSMYVCTCVTQIAVDGFNQMAASSCFRIPFFWELAVLAFNLLYTRPRWGLQAYFSSESCDKMGPHNKGAFWLSSLSG